MKTVWLCGMMLCLAAAAPAAEPYAGPPVLVTRGEAIVRVAPDRARIVLATEARAPDVKQAQQHDAEAMAAVRQRLKQAGIADAAIRTTGYDLHLEFDYQNGKQTPRGYVSRNTIEIRLDDVEKVGSVIEQAVTSGAASVSSVHFELREPGSVEREALRKAVEDARARAEAAAAGAGTSVTGVIRIEEERAATPPQPGFTGMRAEAMATPAAPPIATGELEIRAQVTLTSALK